MSEALPEVLPEAPPRLRSLESFAAAAIAGNVAQAAVAFTAGNAAISGGMTGHALSLGAFFADGASTVFLAGWMWRARTNVELLTGRSGWQWGKGWIVFCWIIPIANLVIPYRIVFELWDRSGRSRPRLLNLWFMVNFVFGLSSIVLGGGFMAAGFGHSTMASLQLALSPLGIVEAVLTIKVIRRVSALQDGLVPATGARPGLVLGATATLAAGALGLALGLIRRLTWVGTISYYPKSWILWHCWCCSGRRM